MIFGLVVSYMGIMSIYLFIPCSICVLALINVEYYSTQDSDLLFQAFQMKFIILRRFINIQNIVGFRLFVAAVVGKTIILHTTNSFLFLYHYCEYTYSLYIPCVQNDENCTCVCVTYHQ